jgi:hypothetical protein
VTTAAQAVIPVVVRHPDGYPDSHEPSCIDKPCFGCDDYRRRRKLHRAAGRKVGVLAKSEPVRQCGVCSAPCYAGFIGDTTPAWVWSQNEDRQHWSIELRDTATSPQFCPRCRVANDKPAKKARGSK